MKLIDKYIFYKFLQTFVFVVLIIDSIVCVIDYTEKINEFIKKKISYAEIFGDYYLNFVPYLTNMLSPITVFIATVFVTARLASRTEIIAILACGVSFRRLLVPYLAGSGILAVLTFILTGWIIPNANKTRVAFDVKYLKGTYYNDERNIHVKVAPYTYAYMQSYNNHTRIGYMFTLERTINKQLEQKLSAERIEWDSVKTVWKIPNYKIHTFQGDIETVRGGSNMDTILNLRPKDFESKHLLHETLTLPELDDYINEQLSRGNTQVGVYVVEKYERYTYPFAIMILTIMGVIVSARKSRQGTGMLIALGFFLAFIFIICVRMSRSMGQAGSIEPIVAAWLPTLIFATITAFMYRNVQK
jgi:lipopolysaccharide export system permease protein